MKSTDTAPMEKTGAAATAGLLAAGLLTSMSTPAFAQVQRDQSTPAADAPSYAEQVWSKKARKPLIPCSGPNTAFQRWSI